MPQNINVQDGLVNYNTPDGSDISLFIGTASTIGTNNGSVYANDINVQTQITAGPAGTTGQVTTGTGENLLIQPGLRW